MSAELSIREQPDTEAIGAQVRSGLDQSCDELRRQLETEAARVLSAATSINFTFSDGDRPAREAPRPRIEPYLTQHEIDSRPPKLKRRVLRRLRQRFISRALLRVDSF
jgi:hypothetical protein